VQNDKKPFRSQIEIFKYLYSKTKQPAEKL
jgi:hypothetical protein